MYTLYGKLAVTENNFIYVPYLLWPRIEHWPDRQKC